MVALITSLASFASSAESTLPRHAEPGAPAADVMRKRDLPRPVLVASQAQLAARYDLLVYGATPGGVACAVRAAREGLTVLLVEHSQHLGGMFSSGLSVMDTLYAGARSPIYDEFRRSIHDYYRVTYGPDSPQFASSRPGHPKTYFEAGVAEDLMNALIAGEPGITVVQGYYPVKAARDGALIKEVTFQEKHGSRTLRAAAGIFADCSYEADLAVIAGAKYRVGREGRDEFGEEHAGRIFLRKSPTFPPPGVDPAIITEYKRLNLFHYDRWFEIVRPESTGVGDRQVQTYNIRAVLTTNPANRYIPDQPPPGYDPAVSREIWSQKPPYSQLLGPLPNQKYLWNMPEVIGPQNDYPDGSWAVREHVIELHRRATAGMLYFLQNDESLPVAVREQWRSLGFARDEFGAYGHLPSEVYARETRRVMGRTIFTENDVRLKDGLQRSTVHADSIGVTEWFVDSHASGTERVKDSIYEGEIYLNYISHPGQIPYRTILPEGFDNLLVPVCLSATHVGWGAIRLEPTWMSIGESAAHAAVLAVERGQPPARIDSDQLIRRLAQHRILISFFNDVALDAGETWVPAVAYFGTQGFFATYDAQPRALVTSGLGQVWAQAGAEWLAGKSVDLAERSRRVLAAEKAGGAGLTTKQFLDALRAAGATFSSKDLQSEIGLSEQRPITRGQAVRLLFALGHRSSASK